MREGCSQNLAQAEDTHQHKASLTSSTVTKGGKRPWKGRDITGKHVTKWQSCWDITGKRGTKWQSRRDKTGKHVTKWPSCPNTTGKCSTKWPSRRDITGKRGTKWPSRRDITGKHGTKWPYHWDITGKHVTKWPSHQFNALPYLTQQTTGPDPPSDSVPRSNQLLRELTYNK